MLSRNYAVCPPYGAGDLSKFCLVKDYDSLRGDLVGEFGSARLPGVPDRYDSKPFGDKALPAAACEKDGALTSAGGTQRMFYDQVRF